MNCFDSSFPMRVLGEPKEPKDVWAMHTSFQKKRIIKKFRQLFRHFFDKFRHILGYAYVFFWNWEVTSKAVSHLPEVGPSEGLHQKKIVLINLLDSYINLIDIFVTSSSINRTTTKRISNHIGGTWVFIQVPHRITYLIFGKLLLQLHNVLWPLLPYTRISHSIVKISEWRGLKVKRGNVGGPKMFIIWQ